MKSYTDIEQSKVLAKILPLKSADAIYIKRFLGLTLGNEPMYHFEIDLRSPEQVIWDSSKAIPCWSLTALLGVLYNYTLQTNTDGTVFVVCESKKPMISDAYYNPIDACYEMILKLHELNLL